MLIQSSVNGHLGGFYLLTIMKSEALSYYVQTSEYLFSVLLGIYIGVELMVYMVTLFNFWRTQQNTESCKKTQAGVSVAWDSALSAGTEQSVTLGTQS